MGTPITSDVYRDNDLQPTMMDTILALLARVRNLEADTSDRDMPAAVTDISAVDLTGQTNTGANYGSTVCGVSFVAPASGRVKVTFGGTIQVTAAGSANAGMFVREGSTIGSGALVYDCTGDPGARITSNVTGLLIGGCTVHMLEGLTPDAYYNVAAVHWVGSGTMAIYGRRVIAEPMF